MKYKVWVIGCVLALLLIACVPQPTETPIVAPSSPTPLPPTVPRLVNPVERDTNTPEPQPTPLAQTPEPSPLPTARAHIYDNVDERAILTAVFPGLMLTSDSQGYQVQGSPDWVVWANDRDEGHITQDQRGELVAIVANQIGSNPPKEESPYGPSSDLLVILENRDGKLVVTHRESISPAVSPLSSDVRIERTVDVAHNGHDDLLVTTNAVQSLVIRTEAHLYRWEGSHFVELWQGLEQDDNTAAVNQAEYSSYQATVDFADEDNDGVDEIIVNGKRTVYPKDNDGRADLTAPTNVSDERSVYDWNGTAFVLDPKLSTPAATVATPTP
jgi:hypothetical protein